MPSAGTDRIRVLIVDDSAVVRMLLRSQLGEFPEIEVVGAAVDGRQALDSIPDLRPDVVLLDLEMPNLNGLQMLEELRQWDARPSVIMFSRFTTRGAAQSIEALFLGADDYVPKPDDRESLIACVQKELVPHILSLAGSQRRRQRAGARPPEGAETKRIRPDELSTGNVPITLRPAATRAPIEIVVIASSTGGPPALAQVLSAFGHDLRVPIMIVQHMPPTFTTALASELNRKTGLVVAEAQPDQPIEAAQVWVAPGDHHLFVCQRSDSVRVHTNQADREIGCRPSADVLFRSATSVFGPRVLGVVLTGMGTDGLAGSRAICEAGGQVLVQDEASSAVWGMPGAVARAGLATDMLPPDGLGRAVARRLMSRKAGG